MTNMKFSDLLLGWKLTTNANFSKMSPKLCHPGKKPTGTWGVNTNIGQ